jgi:hypothetical protein
MGHAVESAEGTAPSAARRTRREPLDSPGSCCSNPRCPYLSPRRLHAQRPWITEDRVVIAGSSSARSWPTMRLEQPNPFARHLLQARQRSYGSVRPRAMHWYSVPRFSSHGRLPWHHGPSSRSSTEAPESSSRPLYAGHRPPSTQAPDGLVPQVVVASGY